MRNKLLRNTLSSQGYIQVNKAIARKLSLESAIMLGELVYRAELAEIDGTVKSDDSFIVYRDALEKGTTLSAKRQRNAEALLVAHHLIKAKSSKRDGTTYKLMETEIERFLRKE